MSSPKRQLLREAAAAAIAAVVGTAGDAGAVGAAATIPPDAAPPAHTAAAAAGTPGTPPDAAKSPFGAGRGRGGSKLKDEATAVAAGVEEAACNSIPCWCCWVLLLPFAVPLLSLLTTVRLSPGAFCCC